MSVRQGVVSLVLGALLVGSSGCSSSNAIEGTVVESKANLNGFVVAKVSRANFGATVSYVYRVYVQPSGSVQVQEILRADKVSDIHVEWVGDSLVVKMKCGRIFSFVNFATVLAADGSLVRTVPIILDTKGLCE